MDYIQGEKVERVIIEFNAEKGFIEIKGNDDVVMHYDISSKDVSNFAQSASYHVLNQLKKKYHNQYVDNFLKRNDSQRFIDEMI